MLLHAAQLFKGSWGIQARMTRFVESVAISWLCQNYMNNAIIVYGEHVSSDAWRDTHSWCEVNHLGKKIWTDTLVRARRNKSTPNHRRVPHVITQSFGSFLCWAGSLLSDNPRSRWMRRTNAKATSPQCQISNSKSVGRNWLCYIWIALCLAKSI